MQVLLLASLIGTAAALVIDADATKPAKESKDAQQWPTSEQLQKANADAMKQYSANVKKAQKLQQKTMTDFAKKQEKAQLELQKTAQQLPKVPKHSEEKKHAKESQSTDLMKGMNALKAYSANVDDYQKQMRKAMAQNDLQKKSLNLISEQEQDPDKLIDAEAGEAPQLDEVPEVAVAEAPSWELRIADTKCEKFVEILENLGNGAAYVGKTYIGGQKMDVVWDTGSDEFVVNSINANNLESPCMDMANLKQHDCYSRLQSKHYKSLAQFPNKIKYGSGNTVVLPGTDAVNLIGNKCPNKGVKFMEVIETDIPQLQSHEIDAVGGLGTKNFERATFLTQMGLDRFSFCFLSDNTRPGKLIWNDEKPDDYTEPGWKFNTMPIHGTDYWAIEATDFTLASPGKDSSRVGCTEKSCMCVVDSGTSLITLDQETLKAVETQLNEFEANSNITCNDENLQQFPVIKFYLAGKEHQFHPQDYLMYTDVDELPAHVREVLHFNAMMFPWLKEPESKKECVMMFTPPMGDGLCILGMPFYRNYLVQFDRESRTISTAPHDGECRPAQASFLQMNTKRQIQRIDPTKLRVSAAYHQLKKQASKVSTATGSFLH